MADNNKLVFFFCPEAGVTPHYATHCIVGRTLSEMGHKVLLTYCYQTFERCPVMDMHQLPYNLDPATKKDVCDKCSRNSRGMLDAYGLQGIKLQEVVTPRITNEVGRIVSNAPQDLREFTYDSIQFGNACAHDVVLAAKKYNFDMLDAETRFIWLTYIKNSLLGYLIVKQICSGLPIGSLVHFNDYSLMLAARFAALKHHIPAYSITWASHKGVDFQRLAISPTIWRNAIFRPIQSWCVWRALSLDGLQVKAVADDVILRSMARGSHVYSPPKTFQQTAIYERLNLSAHKALLVAYTSSYDEFTAGKMLVQGMGTSWPHTPHAFADQIQWLLALTEYVEQVEDIQLVVRIHPREGKNKRDSVISEHLLLLKKAFERPFKNCRFVWPEDQISSYDLAELADVALISWSTIGLEMARMGVPVLAINRGITYPGDDFIECAETPDEYFTKLRVLLKRPVTIDVITHAFRFYHCFCLGHSLDWSDIITTSEYKGLPPFRLTRQAGLIEDVIVNGKDIFEINRERLKSSQSSGSSAQEELAMKKQLRRLLHFLYTGQDVAKDFELMFFDASTTAKKGLDITLEPHQKAIMVKGKKTCYANGEVMYHRFSPMCARLARLCAQLFCREENNY